MPVVSARLLRRLGMLALMRALPDENTLKHYIRAVYMGIAGVMVGSVLLGASLAAGLFFISHVLIEKGWDEPKALLITSLAGIALIVGCFAVASHSFRQLLKMKEEASVVRKIDTSPIRSAFDSVTEGFLEGLVLPNRQSHHFQTERDGQHDPYQ